MELNIGRNKVNKTKGSNHSNGAHEVSNNDVSSRVEAKGITVAIKRQGTPQPCAYETNRNLISSSKIYKAIQSMEKK